EKQNATKAKKCRPNQVLLVCCEEGLRVYLSIDALPTRFGRDRATFCTRYARHSSRQIGLPRKITRRRFPDLETRRCSQVSCLRTLIRPRSRKKQLLPASAPNGGRR